MSAAAGNEGVVETAPAGSTPVEIEQLAADLEELGKRVTDDAADHAIGAAAHLALGAALTHSRAGGIEQARKTVHEAVDVAADKHGLELEEAAAKVKSRGARLVVGAAAAAMLTAAAVAVAVLARGGSSGGES